MAKTFTAIDEQIQAFIESQHMFFVATAPSEDDGHVNLSPKGIDSLQVLGPNSVAYLDYIGSGVETIAHLRQNGRIVIMLCAFEGAPKIVRLHGRGDVVEPGDEGFDALVTRLGRATGEHGLRSVIRIEIDRVSDSCGYGVPNFTYQGPRSQLTDWATHKDAKELLDYQHRENASSVDGLPGLRWPDRAQ
jgi:hypothetical protein